MACIGVAFFSIIFDGSLFQLWGLHRDQLLLESKVSQIIQSTEELNAKIERVSDPNFLELEVRDQLDYVRKGDLVFIFSDSQ